MKIGTVALVVRYDHQLPTLIDSFCDDREIAMLEAALEHGLDNPLSTVYQYRERQAKEDEDFGNYVEELLSQPFIRPEIQEHGLQWLKSKLRIEQYQKSEKEATQVITEYAFKLFRENPQQDDFILASPAAKVRIRIFKVRDASANPANNVA